MANVTNIPSYAAISVQAPGKAGWRRTTLTTTEVILDVSGYERRYVRVECLSGAEGAYVVHDTDDLTATRMDVADTSGSASEALHPAYVPLGGALEFVIPSNLADAPSTANVLRIRAVSSNAHVAVHIM